MAINSGDVATGNARDAATQAGMAGAGASRALEPRRACIGKTVTYNHSSADTCAAIVTGVGPGDLVSLVYFNPGGHTLFATAVPMDTGGAKRKAGTWYWIDSET